MPIVATAVPKMPPMLIEAAGHWGHPGLRAEVVGQTDRAIDDQHGSAVVLESDREASDDRRRRAGLTGFRDLAHRAVDPAV